MLKSHMWLVASVFVSSDLSDGEPLTGFKLGSAMVWRALQSKNSGDDGKGGSRRGLLRIAMYNCAGCMVQEAWKGAEI